MRNAKLILFRPILSLIITTWLALIPLIVRAHEGHGQISVVADAINIKVTEHTLEFEIQLTNYGLIDVTLGNISVPDGKADQFPPETLSGGEAKVIPVRVIFDGPVPGIFTAILDFGEDGQGPLLVMP